MAMYHYFVYGISDPKVWGTFYWVRRGRIRYIDPDALLTNLH